MSTRAEDQKFLLESLEIELEADRGRPNARFVREPLNEGEPSLLELLKADSLDEVRVRKVLQEAKTLESTAEEARLSREERLRGLGFEDPTTEQRKENLALNVALREWPKD